MIHVMVAIFIVGNVVDLFINTTTTNVAFSFDPVIGMGTTNPILFALPFGGWSLQFKTIKTVCIAVIVGLWLIRQRSGKR